METGLPDPALDTLVDATLADTFPASDPPCWTLGREPRRQTAGQRAPECQLDTGEGMPFFRRAQEGPAREGHLDRNSDMRPQIEAVYPEARQRYFHSSSITNLCRDGNEYGLAFPKEPLSLTRWAGE
jgi:hypothetical protein